MATSFRDWPWPLQALLYVGLTIALVLLGFYVPGSPLTNVRTQLETAQAEMKPLEADVQNLRVYKQRRAELQSEMDALQKQLATLQTIVPEEKETDQFILMVQRAALSSGVAIRSLDGEPDRAEALLLRDAVCGGGGWSVLLGSGLLRAHGPLVANHQRGRPEADVHHAAASVKFHMAAGTSVTGTFTITTFFTNSTAAQASSGCGAGETVGRRR